MLVLLGPEQIANSWDVIGAAIKEALPPITSSKKIDMNKILEKLLGGKMCCWVSTKNNNTWPTAVLTTEILEGYGDGQRTLLIYTLSAIDRTEKSQWIEGLETLRKYAASKGCTQIAAYTVLEEVKALVKRLGGEAEYTYISLEV